MILLLAFPRMVAKDDLPILALLPLYQLTQNFPVSKGPPFSPRIYLLQVRTHKSLYIFFSLYGYTYTIWKFQARGPIGAIACTYTTATDNTRSELHLQPTLQFEATLDP